MAQTYDIYLRKRLTEFDLIIKNLPYRDGLIIYNRMYLDAMVNYLCLQKYIIGDTDATLVAEIDNVLERVFNIFSNGMELDIKAELFAGKPIAGKSSAILSTGMDEVHEESFNTFQNFTRLITSALQYDLSKSIGSGESEMRLSTRSAHTMKEAFEQFRSAPILNADVTTAAEVYAEVDWQTVLKTDEFDIFYMIAVQGEAVMNLLCSADLEMWYTLGTAENYMYLSIENSSVQSEKFMTYQDFLPLIAEINGMLECFINPLGGNILLSSALDAGMKRHRLLSEVDELTLADLDAMSLDDLDYVILA